MLVKIIVVTIIVLILLLLICHRKRPQAGRKLVSVPRSEVLILYTFDVGTRAEDTYMLEASIISVLRELGSRALIFVYTNTVAELIHLEKRYREANLSVKRYQPDITLFKTIGRARMYLIPNLLREFMMPIIYLNNDTLLINGRGNELLEHCDKDSVFGYLQESWTTFEKLYGPNYNCDSISSYLSLNPINNGVQIFPYNETSVVFADDVLAIYTELSKCRKSRFRGTLAFSIIWWRSPQSRVLTNDGPVLHYYFMKNWYLPYIKYVTKLLVGRFMVCGATYLLPEDLDGSFIINTGLICEKCPGEIPVCDIPSESVLAGCSGGTKVDCAGICGGRSVTDCAGVCYKSKKGPPHLLDCAGECYRRGTMPPNTPDCAGECYKDGESPKYFPDCNGVCGGNATYDCAGICGGRSYEDCGGNCIDPDCSP
uniref:Uncharacterized protein n=1 Tax=viral metagenome TaxID=1070528 RepID=A0A6C0CIK9_9ZZZZ